MLSLLVVLSASGCAAPASLEEGMGRHDSVSVSVHQQARPADSLVNSLGLNVHLSYFQTTYGTGWQSIVKPKLIELGVRHLRDHGDVVPGDSWMRTVYGRMGELAAAGIKFNLVLRPEQNSNNFVSLPQFERLMQYAAPSVEAFEGLNEHDISKRGGWVSEVRSFQRALYTAVKADSRTANLPVYGPSMAHAGNAASVGALSEYMTMGSIHPYPGGSLPMTSIGDHERRTAVISGALPLVVTEAGYHTATQWTGPHPGISEEAQARYTPRLLLEFFNAGIQRSFLYEFVDQGSDNREREQKFGLLRSNGSEKPAYTSLKNLITILKDPGPAFATGTLGFTLDGDSSKVERTVLQKRDGRFYLILWQNERSYDLQARSNITVNSRTAHLTLATRAQTIRIYNPLQSATPVEQYSDTGNVPLQISDSPLIVEITP
jgi:hypothetical protein